MPLNRRTLLSGLAAGIALPAFRLDALRRVAAAQRSAGSRPTAEVAGDEAYWSEIARAFDADRTLVNLNNGGCSPAPPHPLEAMIRRPRLSHQVPVPPKWDGLCPPIEAVRAQLAA